jgi:hypothetical protein
MLCLALWWLFLSPLGRAQSPRIELPPGPAAEALARVSADTRPAALPKIPVAPWEEPATWRRWAELLSAESTGSPPDPARRAELALLALAQHRWDDAWRRFIECSASPAVVAALRPHFLPGTDGRTLGDGALLTPALPPSSTPAPSGRVERRSMRIEGLEVGAAVLAVRVSVEVEGVQIDIEHLSGGAVKLSIAIPEDREFGFADEYVDWYRQEKSGVAHEVTIRPGDEPHTLYARFEPRAPAWPTLLPERLPAQIAEGTLWLESRATAPGGALLQAVAESLAAGPLRLSAHLREPHSAGEGFTGVSIDLADPVERPRKLAWIAGAVERRALERPR